jgi:cell division protein ZapA
MAEVSLSVGGRAYRLACRDGEEEDLRAAASLLDSRVSGLMQAHGAIAEPRLLLMAALLLSGELLERKAGNMRPLPAAVPEPGPRMDRAAFESLAARAERLAQRLEEASVAS